MNLPILVAFVDVVKCKMISARVVAGPTMR
jgi:hypothetical protein